MEKSQDDISRFKTEDWLQKEINYYTTVLGYEMSASRSKSLVDKFIEEQNYVYGDQVKPYVREEPKHTLREKLGLPEISPEYSPERPFSFEEQMSADAKQESVMYYEQQCIENNYK